MGLLFIYSSLDLLEFLHLWTTVFHQFWKIIFKYRLCPILSPVLLELHLRIC